MAGSAALVNKTLPTVELPSTLARTLTSGHPWIYRDHVPRGFEAETGTFVRVVAGTFSAVALWDATSPLALRIFSRNEVPTAESVEARVRAAQELREITGVTASASAYRFINGEGDGLPGVTVDRYGPYAVLTTDGPAIESIVPFVVAALSRAASLQGIVRRIRGAEAPAGAEPRGEDAPAPATRTASRLEVLAGRMPPRDLIVEEHGLRFVANLHEGQKTGLFLDQRENRRYIESIAGGKRVLNLFGYTGGFSLYAARGGATETVTVDVATGALESARENFRLNGFSADAQEFAAVDAFEYLRAARDGKERFGIVICDPPSFARSRAHRDRAIDAYVRLHAAALAVTEPGGLYAASSCTTQVGIEAFHSALAAAARKASVTFQIVHDVGHAADHPILAGHPEGRYLKFVVGRVTPRR
ncbi:MAG TPA: class I SAM-dependent rRNA methyltransferase [Polyangiaceae bacterium]